MWALRELGLAKRGGYFPRQTHWQLWENSLLHPFTWHACVIKSQAITPFKNTVVIICRGFINLIQDLYRDALTHFLLSISTLPLAYIINPPSGMLRCSSVKWIYANGCLHMLISHIYIKLNSLLYCFLTLCPHMINFPDFFQNRY